MANSNQPERFRLFVAVLIPEEIKRKIAGVQAELRRDLPERGVTWTKSEQLHLTMKFLGNVEAKGVQPLTEHLRTACEGFSSLRLRAEQVGAFPDLRFPRVFWVGISDAEGKLPQLQRAVEAACRNFTAEEPEDRFAGHVTLGRAKRLHRREAETLSGLLLRMADQSFGQWTADAIELMRSQLSSEGARHTMLATVPFGSMAT